MPKPLILVDGEIREHAEDLHGGVRKSADEIVNNSTTFQDDEHLALALAANESIEFMLLCIYSSGASPDFKLAFSVPSGATGGWTIVSPNASSAEIQRPHHAWLDGFGDGNSQNIAGAGTAIKRSLVVYGFVDNGATPGDLQFRWAQDSAVAADTTVHEGSLFRPWRL